jgi:hypothetical protein
MERMPIRGEPHRNRVFSTINPNSERKRVYMITILPRNITPMDDSRRLLDRLISISDVRMYDVFGITTAFEPVFAVWIKTHSPFGNLNLGWDIGA